MVKRRILLNSVEKIKDFANMICRYPNDFDLVSGRFTIDAKSIMGIFSLDLTHPLELCIYGDEDEELLEALKPYLADAEGCDEA